MQRPFPYSVRGPAVAAAGEPFGDATEAWFWCVAAETARQDGARPRAGEAAVERPCEPADILRSIDRLYRDRTLLPAHLKVLVHFGRRFAPPDGTARPHRRAARLWAEAMARIEPVLRNKGIVA